MNMSVPSETKMTSREFNQDTASAKRAAARGPVFITTRGRPTHVLMTIEEYERTKAPIGDKPFRSLADALADPNPLADFDWEPPRFTGFSLKVPDFD